ncbi:MAG: DUF6036 family nucleotidyltransferase [Promethearchaeota archaeon]
MPSDTRLRDERIQEAQRIIDSAQKQNVLLRLIGGLAIRRHCEIIGFCERDYADIDLVGLRKQSPQIIKVMEALGYQEDAQVAIATDGQRMLFLNPHSTDHIDIFLDTFEMEHSIDLKHRLTIEPYTISISDLLLTKLQIHRLNEKDVRDILTLIKDIPQGTTDEPGIINITYIATLCAKDWGLYHDVTTNITKVLQFLPNYSLSSTEIDHIRLSLHHIQTTIEQAPKGRKWQLRKRLGTRKTWRREVEDQSEPPTMDDTSLSRS